MQHRGVPARLDQFGADPIREIGRLLLGGTARAGRAEEFDLHEVPGRELVVEFVDDRIDAALADPDGDVEIVCLLLEFLDIHTRR